MNGTQLERFEENRENNLVKHLGKLGYKPKEILELCDVPELGLRKEKVIISLAEHNLKGETIMDVSKDIFSVIKKIAEWTPRVMYTPFSIARRIGDYPFGLAGSLIGGLAIPGAIIKHLDRDLRIPYILTYLGIVTVDGLYNLYLDKKKKIIERRASELERKVAD